MKKKRVCVRFFFLNGMGWDGDDGLICLIGILIE